MLKQIVESYPEEKILKADGFDKAVIGIEQNTMRLIYSKSKCIDVLMKRDKMKRDEAIEFFEFNVSGSHMGKKTPIWCEDLF